MSKLEYLDENYKLHVIDGESEAVPEGWILVPEGADTLIKFKSGHTLIADMLFYKFKPQKRVFRINEWVKFDEDFKKPEDFVNAGDIILWQRESKSEVVELKGVDSTLAERQAQYGSFEDVSFVTENIISVLKRCNYDEMPNPHKMAMYMIASKIARLVSGDCNHLDSWHDIGGYSKLIENLIEGK